MNIKVKKTFRATKIIGKSVRNPEYGSIGEIKDIVIDVEDGDVAYAVVRFREWFHDKLFAVPWQALMLMHDDTGQHFILDTTRERLREAPGFDPDDWPDVASSDWREEIDNHYNF